MSGRYVVKMRTAIYGVSHDLTAGEKTWITAMGPWSFWGGAGWMIGIADAKRLGAADAVALVASVNHPGIEAVVEEVA